MTGPPREYRARQAAAAHTRRVILEATRRLVREGRSGPTIGAIARAAEVSRLSVYHHFGSRAGVLAAVAAEAGAPPAADDLHGHLAAAAAHWASDPPLYRRLPDQDIPTHGLAAALAAQDRLRPGCSIKEAEDVIAVLSSFRAFDRLHQDGRRSTPAVVEILMRMSGSILRPPT